ncbi:TetR family transcriptional regulator [Micromonospora sp. 067-2]|uniref:TetR family transcriptional regulator n=1 Tax=Micromonospora sp. 067-2 TaxID=2789270 RepID=UPI00397922BE
MAAETGPARPARDAARTRRRILAAATDEFAAFGLAGGRTARIAEAAAANQRMLYAYFGNKDGLFDAVIEHHVLQAQDSVGFDATDLPGYAVEVFDFYRGHPHLVRLALWQTLERPDLMRTLPLVVRAMRDKAEAVAEAQTAGLVSTVLPADRLLDTVLTLAHGSITAAGNAADWTDTQREDLHAAVLRLVTPPARLTGG